MAWTLVQHAMQASGNSALQRQLGFGASVTAGNLLAMAVSMFSGSSPTATPADTLGNTWTQLGSYSRNGSNTVAIFATLAGTSGGSDTLKWTPNVSVFGGFVIAEFSPPAGFAAPYTLDGSVTNTGSANPTSSGSIPVAGANELALAAFCQGSGTRTWTPGTGFSNVDVQTNGNTAEGAYMDYATASTAVADAGAFNVGSLYAALGASVKATSSAGGGPWPWYDFGIGLGGQAMTGGICG
ncbi:MAG: hypothetical protein KGL39_41630 [Patescibacteria group bacterium]|nr:hypothetical protein [Patescibacteria group bacterium]